MQLYNQITAFHHPHKLPWRKKIPLAFPWRIFFPWRVLGRPAQNKPEVEMYEVFE